MSKFYLPAARLRANRACEEEVARFERTFGPKAQVLINDENFEKALAARLPIWWLALQYLGKPAFYNIEGDDVEYSTLYEAHNRHYWKAIKAEMERDNAPRPEAWY